MKNLKVNSIDLWLITTGDEKQRFAEYAKAFRAGFNTDKINKAVTPSYDFYRLYKNCNCAIFCSGYKVFNCPAAIVFYRDGQPIRLLVDISDTDIDKCIHYALPQRIANYSLMAALEKAGVKSETVELHQNFDLKSIRNKNAVLPKISSCDRWDLLLQFFDNMKTDGGKYYYDPSFSLTCKLTTDREKFHIQHLGAFISTKNYRHCIVMQRKSALMA